MSRSTAAFSGSLRNRTRRTGALTDKTLGHHRLRLSSSAAGRALDPARRRADRQHRRAHPGGPRSSPGSSPRRTGSSPSGRSRTSASGSSSASSSWRATSIPTTARRTGSTHCSKTRRTERPWHGGEGGRGRDRRRSGVRGRGSGPGRGSPPPLPRVREEAPRGVLARDLRDREDRREAGERHCDARAGGSWLCASGRRSEAPM